MFDITKDHIKLLNDADLRELIGRLCEAELETNGISRKYANWGGAQTTADGGADVTVVSPNDMNGFIPRRYTVFQVKKASMPPSEIKKEMALSKTGVWQMLNELNDKAGAYIIVCAKDDTTNEPMLKDRTNNE